jgi:uncharacterized protein YjbI with pentapeptide repeats
VPTRVELASVGKVELKADRWQMATAIASLLSVLAVGVGLIVTNTYNRDQQRLALQGQITDRFTKAIEQLGQAGPLKIDVRLGAIYALQRIMRDSANDQPAVVDILSAFVRVHALGPGPALFSRLTPRPVDIQAALTVLARRDPAHDGAGRVDLSQADLSAVRLASATMRRADLASANLIRADLSGTNLSHADLSSADLSGANLSGANLSHANLRGANLSLSNLSDADLSGADLRGAELRRGAGLEVILGDTELRDAELHGTDLRGADLRTTLLAPGQLRCTFVDQATLLPQKTAGPLLFALLTDPQCK